MSAPAIVVEGLSKRFRIGRPQARYRTLREAFVEAARAPLRRLLRREPPEPEFWALKDVSFSVEKGQVVGVIGRNGAGKSTLLKILSRITEPTSGRVTIRGRVASLLEVGTGFHPELTGRENVYLNGAILGMKRREIDRKFDEIVAFAEVEKFLDTPVKHYSSGMHMRLAFAVAAHLDCEILVVDEVLAVGDAAFQKKCMGKMAAVAGSGKTVLLVSHNLAAVSSLAERALQLERGRLTREGAGRDVVGHYMKSLDEVRTSRLRERTDRRGNQALTFTDLRMLNRDGATVPRVGSGDALTIELDYDSRGALDLRNVSTAIGVHDKNDESLFHLWTETTNADFGRLPPTGRMRCTMDRVPLQPGVYRFNLYCTVGGEVADWIVNAGAIEVDAGDFFGTGRLPPAGTVLVAHRWEFSSVTRGAT